jgi:hypothetical protein
MNGNGLLYLQQHIAPGCYQYVLLVVQVLDVVVVMLALDVLVGLCRQEKSSACALSRC